MDGSVHWNLAGGKTLIESIFFYIAFKFWVPNLRHPKTWGRSWRDGIGAQQKSGRGSGVSCFHSSTKSIIEFIFQLFAKGRSWGEAMCWKPFSRLSSLCLRCPRKLNSRPASRVLLRIPKRRQCLGQRSWAANRQLYRHWRGRVGIKQAIWKDTVVEAEQPW